MNNTLSFVVRGKYALFTDPASKTGGDKSSYPVPTYEALKGVIKSVYWKPTLIWIVKQVRILNPIRMESKSIKPRKMSGGNTLAYYSYLADVAYQVEVQFVWNTTPLAGKYAKDRIDGKHYQIAQRMIEKGGRRDVFLGTRECQAYVEPCRFGEGPGYYDGKGVRPFGIMFHSFAYPSETGIDELRTQFWNAEMRDGVIEFPLPEACDPAMSRFIRKMKAVLPESCGLNEETLRNELD